MKKVCILTTAHPRFDTRVFFREARSLAKEFDTTLLVADGSPAENRDGVSIRPIADRVPQNRPERMFRFTALMFKAAMAEDADVYHFHDTELFPTALRLKRRGKTVIYDAHESIADTILDRDYLPRWMLKLLSRVMYRFERYTARRMDAVVTVTPFLRDRFANWGCRVHMVCNFPVLEDFAEGDTPWTEREDAACYAGAQIDRSRGVFEMAEAVQSEKLPLHFFGRIPAGVGEGIRAIDGNKLVTMHGSVEHAALRHSLCHSRYGLVTEYATGNAVNAYCIKMFEYMAAGMAIVSTDIPLWREIVEETGCGVCVPDKDADKLAAALAHFRADPAAAAAMGRAGRRAAETVFNWKTQEQVLLDLYKKLTSEAIS